MLSVRTINNKASIKKSRQLRCLDQHDRYGLEESQEQIHKIRITLSSKHILNIKKDILKKVYLDKIHASMRSSVKKRDLEILYVKESVEERSISDYHIRLFEEAFNDLSSY